MSKMLLVAFVSTPFSRVFGRSFGYLWTFSGLQLTKWPLNFAMRHHWLLSGFDLENQTIP